jgi:CheY-like chemotaxis protein
MSAPIKTVFLIDDDPMSNMIHQSLLKKHHWQATTVVFENGSAALQALQTAAAGPPGSFPEVILLDLEMPVYDGWDFMADYRQLPTQFTSRCLLYLLSSSIKPSDIRKAQTYPLVQSYLTKPLTAANLNQISQDFPTSRRLLSG